MKFVFFKSKEHTHHYFIYLTSDGNNVERMFQKFTHTGEFEESGYLKMEIEKGPEFISKYSEDFLDFLAANIATNHIPNRYDERNYRAYYEFKTLDFSSWEKQFEESLQAKNKQRAFDNPAQTIQTTLNF